MRKVTREYIMDILKNYRSVTSLDEIPGLSNWDVSEITTFSYMFYNFKNLTDIQILSN